jgi:hypothetical protein
VEVTSTPYTIWADFKVLSNPARLSGALVSRLRVYGSAFRLESSAATLQKNRRPKPLGGLSPP